ncbi:MULTISPECIES: pyridoxal phosphate-dependent aminotransferase [Bordetella]|uniref:Aminotransferase n=3 Tax=Bordetella TaxID=517 RepID=K0MG89_BORPB|nr:MULTISPECIES: pyridoxal phosphate-dependent aminotransferase [Bordetella]SHS84589.1 succinyldiaminopimelate aminotransferase [Mycobacteroides abscessus subsp. abscessus]AWP76158.1 aspartate aminotransferase [Bordetella bronchiseptica]AWP80998.1 aspartate aminotransferase [Bordetella bronchiseptica]AWP85797.1 aspartate aminotransferase [Bordetella bronchiseptica]AWQ11366.1 aspartate aminotransferase [Bordetella bronchiseptica]
MRFADRMARIAPSPSSMAGQRMRELRAAGRDVIGLTAGEPDFATPDNIQQAALRAMRNGQTKYTDVGGVPELKAAVAEKFRRENSLAYRQDQIIVSSGAKQVIFNALLCLVQRGDEVVIPAPYWVSYPDMVRFAGGTPVAVACAQQHRFKLQPDELERAITPRTRCLILNSPNNPSGAAYDETELKALAQVLLRHPDICVITDDIYEHLLYDGRRFATIAAVEPALADRVLTVNGVSKSYAMTGWRIGYAGGPAALIANMVKLQSQSTSCPSAVSQAAAIEALTGPQDIIASSRKLFQARRDLLVRRINAIPGLHCDTPDGAFYVFASCAGLAGKRTPQGRTIDNDTDLALHLLDAEGVVVIQGDAYGMPGFFRLSIAASETLIEEAQRRIAAACAALH